MACWRWRHRRGAHFLAETTVTGFEPVASGWRVEREGAEPLVVDAVIVATGGLSVPNTGSDGRGLAILAALGHTVHPTYAALTPALANPAPFAALAGVSLPVTITARDGQRSAGSSGGFLFTHRGYSGPSVLDVSHVVVRSRLEGDAGARLLVQWTGLDEAAWESALDAGRAPGRSQGCSGASSPTGWPTRWPRRPVSLRPAPWRSSAAMSAAG